MLRLSKLTDYAVVVLVRLAGAPGVQTSPGIAATTGIPEPTVAKVLKTLAAGGLVASQRGARGGYRLLRPLAEIPVADVIATVDGPIALAACVDGSSTECESQGLCPIRGRWDPVNDAIHQALSAITLADMQAAGIPRAFRVPAGAPGAVSVTATRATATRATATRAAATGAAATGAAATGAAATSANALPAAVLTTNVLPAE